LPNRYYATEPLLKTLLDLKPLVWLKACHAPSPPQSPRPGPVYGLHGHQLHPHRRIRRNTIEFDASDLDASNFDVWVETASISTGNKTKDKHARGGSWLDAEAFPRIGFQSKSFVKTDAGYSVEGQLNIHGVSKTVSIPFTFSDNVFSGRLTVVREDYGIEGPFLFGGLVGDEIRVLLRIPVE